VSDFQTKFNGRILAHRAQMLQILIAISREVLNGSSGPRFRQNFLAHAKKLGWLPSNARTRKQALPLLVDQAKLGFGYVPRGTVLKAMQSLESKSKKVA
jgi:hypothetical protein